MKLDKALQLFIAVPANRPAASLYIVKTDKAHLAAGPARSPGRAGDVSISSSEGNPFVFRLHPDRDVVL